MSGDIVLESGTPVMRSVLVEATEQCGVAHDIPEAVTHFLEGDVFAIQGLTW
jgi:hypothetical protein